MEVKIPTMSKEYKEKEQKKKKETATYRQRYEKEKEIVAQQEMKIRELRERAESYKSKLIVYKDIVELLLSKLVDRE